MNDTAYGLVTRNPARSESVSRGARMMPEFARGWEKDGWEAVDDISVFKMFEGDGDGHGYDVYIYEDGVASIARVYLDYYDAGHGLFEPVQKHTAFVPFHAENPQIAKAKVEEFLRGLA